MAKTSIGELNVKLTAQADEFDKVIAGAERKMTSFANTLASPLNLARGFGMGIGSAFANPFMTLVTDATRFGALIPGIGLSMESIAHPMKTAEESMERLVHLGKDAEDIGVSTQFMRSIQIAAGPEVEAMEKAVLKLMKIKSEIGNTGTSEKFLRDIIAQGAAIESAEGRIRFAADKVGIKSAMGLVELFQKGPEGLDKIVAKVEKLGLGMESNVKLAEQWRAVIKDVALKTESQGDKSVLSGGLMSMGIGQMKVGDVGEGMENLVAGGENWIRRVLRMDQLLTPGQTLKVFSATRDELFKSLDLVAGDKNKMQQITSMIDFLNERETATKSGGGFQLSEGGAAGVAKWATIAATLAGTSPKALMPPPEKSKAFWAEQASGANKVAEELSILETTFGMTAKAAALYGAAFHGASEGQLEDMGKIIDLKERAALISELETPSEKAAKEMARLGTLDLDPTTRRRALQRLQKGLQGDIGGADTQANTALVGSQEWAKAFTRGADNVKTETEDQLEEQRKANGLLADIKDELKQTERPMPLNIPPGP